MARVQARHDCARHCQLPGEPPCLEGVRPVRPHWSRTLIDKRAVCVPPRRRSGRSPRSTGP